MPLKFRPGGVTYVMKGYPWEITVEVHTLPRIAKDSQDNLRDAIAYTRSHFAS